MHIIETMETVENKTFDEERALYGLCGITVKNCRFDGPADGESAFKECRNIVADSCFFNLRYPFWHDDGIIIRNAEMTELCRAALWYTRRAQILNSRLHGIKALRECADIKMKDCQVVSPEFGWSVQGIEMDSCSIEGEYFMLRSNNLRFNDVKLKGKYSFQYIEDAVFDNCNFDTKDAFWHAKNVTVKNSTLKGEYLAWYCENVTFVNCKIIGTQPLCYCKGLKLVDCQMIDTDLAFEKSQVEATLTAPIISIKNPLCGRITAPSAGEIIRDDSNSQGEVIIKKRCHCA